MSAYFDTELSVPNATATLVAAAEGFPRRVHLHDLSGSLLRVAFDSTSVVTGVLVSDLASDTGVLGFLIPTDQELWVHQSSGTAKTLAVLVSAAEE